MIQEQGGENQIFHKQSFQYALVESIASPFQRVFLLYWNSLYELPPYDVFHFAEIDNHFLW